MRPKVLISNPGQSCLVFTSSFCPQNSAPHPQTEPTSWPTCTLHCGQRPTGSKSYLTQFSGHSAHGGSVSSPQKVYQQWDVMKTDASVFQNAWTWPPSPKLHHVKYYAAPNAAFRTSHETKSLSHSTPQRPMMEGGVQPLSASNVVTSHESVLSIDAWDTPLCEAPSSWAQSQQGREAVPPELLWHFLMGV